MSQPAGEPSPALNGLFRRRSPDGPEVTATTTRRTHFLLDGHLSTAPQDVSIADASMFADAEPTRMALLLFPMPTTQDVEELATAWQLHPVLVEDLKTANQRPKLERYGDILFLVVRSARYVDDNEYVDLSEFHVLIRNNSIAVLCQDGRWIDGSNQTDLPMTTDEIIASSDHTLLDDPYLLDLGPEAVLYRLLDAIVDGYAPAVQGLAIDKEQIESQVFDGGTSVAERIYRLSQEIIELQHATRSLADVLDSLRLGFKRYEIPTPLQTHLQDVADHLTRINLKVSELRESLAQILSVNATLVAQRQNEDMKKISGWAAILFAPTLIGAIYGMNFDDMPELHWALGYPMAIAAMLALGVALYFVFKYKKWM